ncbi:nuclear body protein SP140-like [Ornithorhynchus anatinus]|uniref:SP110 nuclear body protein n=1 Tax=Ornithorhynchus anatinus TaxID=9258 RepID=K7E9R3_ORNAN|nr:nuclear body protein SP140-like [Ornithorhynchus anatinus]XP_028925358.1 nuclear body protein SP140-like [Ornithorhynchus anatinus]XP_028925359.1 nuclear body protein SP140-like [Ornithorhynchus anatinus]XP_028925360.1 nuclear body protein SP140-like [Ornithorhynchus anatinus]
MDPKLEKQLLIKFREKKLAISDAVNKLFPFIYSLRDQALISNRMLQHYKNESVPMKERIYNVLEKLEKNFNKKVLKVLFSRNNVKEYPDLKRIRRTFEDVLSEDSSPERSDSERPAKISNVRSSPQDTRRVENPLLRRKKLRKTLLINSIRRRGLRKQNLRTTLKRPTLRKSARQSQSQSVDFRSPQLPVTCSKASGTLYQEKMKKGSLEKCIMDANGNWLTLREFEIKGKREHFKNWRKSISCGGHTLEWLQKERLIPKPPTQYRRRKRVVRKKLPLKESQRPAPGAGREESGATAGLPAYLKPLADVNSFLVTCGEVVGNLYKNRFASGSRGKCIRTDKHWFTPEEFLNSADKIDFLSWFKEIRASDIPLQTLIEKKILRLHTNQCRCLLCTEGTPHPENDDECAVCRNGGMLICCDSCPNSFHEDCHIPKALSSSPEWICTYCRMEKAEKRCPPNVARHPELQVLKMKMLPEELLKCEFLLLKIFCLYDSKIFIEDPERIKDYYQHIKEPMWLNLIKERLHQGMYNTIEGFVLDMRLIFKNCWKFNKNNKFGQMGIKLKKVFEKNFKQVFSIQEIEEAC